MTPVRGPLQAYVLGRVGVDLTPPAPRTSLAGAVSFVGAVGGFAGNIGTGLARLGIATGVVSSVGDDGHGDYVRAALGAEGIDVAGLTTRPGSRTQVAFFEAWPPDHFPVTFYRPEPAPETLLTLADVPLAALESAPLVIVSGTLLAAEPARTTTLAILAARQAAAASRGFASWTILDLDWRPTLWSDPAEYPRLIAQAATLSDILIGSDSEFRAAGLEPGGTGSEQTTVLKHGPDGVSLLGGGSRQTLPGIAVDVVCGLGSGDALTAAVAAGLLNGLDPWAALKRGNAAGAIVASRLMCSSAMPTPSEIDEVLS